MIRRTVLPICLGCWLLAGAGCDLTAPETPPRPSMDISWTPSAPRAAFGVPSEFLWAGDVLDLEILDAEGVTHRRSWPLGPSGVSVDASFQVAAGPYTARATVTSNGSRRLLEGTATSDAARATLPLVEQGPILAVSPVVATPTEFAPDTVRIWNLGSGVLAWSVGLLNPPNSSCASGRCLALRVPDSSPIRAGDSRELWVASFDTRGGDYGLTLFGGDGVSTDSVVLPIKAGPAKPVGRITVLATLRGSPLAQATVEITGPGGAFQSSTDANGIARFESLPFGLYQVFVFFGNSPFQGSVTLDAFARDVRVEAELS